MSAIVEWLRWSGAIAEIVAGFCLAWPALRMSRYLLQLDRIEAGRSDDGALEALRTRTVEAGRQGLSRWDRRDHRLLSAGITAFLYGASARLALLVLT